MTLTLSTTLTHIDIDESDIIEIYRSAQPVTPSDSLYDGHPCEAYLCTGRKGNLLLAYVAILDTATKTPFIFTSSCDAKDTAACAQLVTKANEFIASLGFSLEKVAIDYGVAMRQVIIRNLSIMHPPQRTRTDQSPKKQAPAAEKPTAPAATVTEPSRQHVSPAPSKPGPAPEASKPSHAETPREDHSRLSAELSALREAHDRLAQEKAEAEATAGQTIADLKKKLEHAVAACAKAEKSIRENQAQYQQADNARAQEIDRLEAKLKLATESRQAAEESLGRNAAQLQETETRASGEIARLEAALEEERTRFARFEARLHKAEDNLKKAEDKLQQAEDKLQKAEDKLQKTEDKLQKAEDKLQKTEDKLQKTEDKVQKTEDKVQKAEDKVQKAGSNLVAETKRRCEIEMAAKKQERSLGKELDVLREEVNTTKALLREREEQYQTLQEECDQLTTRLSESQDTVQPEHETHDSKHMQDAKQLRTANQELTAQLKDAQKEHDLGMRTLEAKLRSANEKVEALTTDVEQLSSEKRSLDAMNSILKKKVRGAVEQLKNEKQELEEELQRLRAEIKESPPPSAIPIPAPAPVAAPAPRTPEAAGADATPSRAAATYAMGTSLGSAGSAFQSGESSFRHDPKLTTITCDSPDKIIEVHASINAIQAGPFGKKPQMCLAYILGVQHGQKSWIYLAWLLKEDREVLVCKPEKQPEDADGYAAMMRDAIFYFESTGFMMDRFDLSKGGQHQLKTLEESGICRFGA